MKFTNFHYTQWLSIQSLTALSGSVQFRELLHFFPQSELRTRGFPIDFLFEPSWHHQPHSHRTPAPLHFGDFVRALHTCPGCTCQGVPGVQVGQVYVLSGWKNWPILLDAQRCRFGVSWLLTEDFLRMVSKPPLFLGRFTGDQLICILRGLEFIQADLEGCAVTRTLSTLRPSMSTTSNLKLCQSK